MPPPASDLSFLIQLEIEEEIMINLFFYLKYANKFAQQHMVKLAQGRELNRWYNKEKKNICDCDDNGIHD
jgi:hypothetical protein